VNNGLKAFVIRVSTFLTYVYNESLILKLLSDGECCFDNDDLKSSCPISDDNGFMMSVFCLSFV